MPDPRQRLPGLVPVFLAQIRYQLSLLLRTPRALVSGLVMPALLLALELGGVRHPGSATAGTAALAPQVAGLLVFGMAAIALFTHANSLVVAREAGVLRRWRAAPLPAGAYFAGKIAATVLAADGAGAVLVLVSMEMAKLHLTAHAALALLAAGTLGALAFAAASTAMTVVIPTVQAAQPVLMLVYLPLIFLSGVFGHTAALPHWLTTAVSYLPAQPVINATALALQHSGGALVPARDLAVLGGWLVGGLLVSLRYFRWDPRRPARARHGGTTSASRSTVTT
jgi:ABC-2 type transport system permease protein